MARLLNCGFEAGSLDIFDYIGGAQSSSFETATATDLSKLCFRHGFNEHGWNLGMNHTEQYGGVRYKWLSLSGTANEFSLLASMAKGDADPGVRAAAQMGAHVMQSRYPQFMGEKLDF